MTVETAYRPTHSYGADLDYNDQIALSGVVTHAELRRFIRARRDTGFGPTTLYYAGLVAPAISAGAATLFDHAFKLIWPESTWLTILILLCSALAGLSWFLIFNRLASRSKTSRDMELQHPTRININANGLTKTAQAVKTQIEWPAVMDIRITKHYIAFIVEGTNDIFIPVDWFGGPNEMKLAAEKIVALRPPPHRG